MHAFAERLGLLSTFRRFERRFKIAQEQPDLLPDLDGPDHEQALWGLVPPEQRSGASRQRIADLAQDMRVKYSGKPYILYWHALAIAYLRRNTSHTDHARTAFFSFWDNHGDWLAENLNSRWLISALQTFADHGRNSNERAAGLAGFLYGNLIKIYESEILTTQQAEALPEPLPDPKINGFFSFRPGDDILANINMLTIGQAKGAGGAGLALIALMSHVKRGKTIFSRVDRQILDRVVVDRNMHLSFGKLIRADKD
ncbi:MAG: hypothetical protein ACK5LJ_01205 [Paracoccus sp. (in: a-proteobacteria)]